MKINTNSWHYKLAEFGVNRTPHKSLCLYFWQVLCGIFGLVVSLCMVAIICAFASTPVLMFFFDDFILGVVGCVVGLTISAMLFYFLCKRWMETADEASFTKVVAGFLSSKKKKICPELEFHS